MDKQKQIQTLNEVLALVDALKITGADAHLIIRIKENILTVGNTIAQELVKEQQPPQA